MATAVEQHEKIIPKSALRHRPIGDTTETAPVTTPRASRPKHRREPHTTGGPPSGAGKKPVQTYTWHWTVSVGITMAATVTLILLFQIIWAWGTTFSNDLRYGRPRTFQTDAVVGHQDSKTHPSHFIAVNLNGRVQILELPGGDATHARVYSGPQLSGKDADLVPVTLHFVDTHGDHHPMMIAQFGGLEVRYANEKGVFVLQ
ncbi:MAG: hypothetical protein J2P36_24375 [Ktedonobacteraceae bacterium]|nr:hypothetical protein [Ktedonobacteraceae bacterium]